MFTVIHKRKSRTTLYAENEPIKGTKRILFLFFLLLLGLSLGAFVVRNGENNILSRLQTLIGSYIEVRQTQRFAVNFNNTFLRDLLGMLLIFCLGLCAVGMPMLYLMPVLYGTGVGMVSAFLYKTYMLKGIGYCALIFYPGEIVYSAVLLYACGVAIEMAYSLMRRLSAQPDDDAHALRAYCIRFAVLTAISAVGAILQNALSALFSAYFQFS